MVSSRCTYALALLLFVLPSVPALAQPSDEVPDYSLEDDHLIVRLGDEGTKTASGEEPGDEPARPAPIGSVVQVEAGLATIDIGQARGVAGGDRVEFFVVQDVDLGGGEVVSREHRLSVGEVEIAGENRSQVKLGLNEDVPVGAKVRPTEASLTRNLLSPRRVGGIFEAAVTIRPFLALGTIGGGAIMDGGLAYRLDAPVSLDLVVNPFGFGIARDGGILTFASHLILSYDTTPFQIGLGGGVSQVNIDTQRGGNDFIPGPDAQRPALPLGFSAAQFVRLGSRDGLHATVLNNFVLYGDEFRFGGIAIEALAPLRVFTDHSWLLVRGGGGVPGHIFAELGIRVLAVGNGQAGSLFLTPTIGGGMMTGTSWVDCEGYRINGEWVPADARFPAAPEGEERVDGICRQSVSYGGPLVGFGMEWRL